MSSIQSFLRQRNVANSILQAPTNNCYYNFIADGGNYVGNYPPGHMELAAVNPVDSQEDPAKILIRDMGKTIKAVIGVLPAATAGFFREIQLIHPVPAVSATGSTTFGVGINSAGAGPNAGNAGYGTYYIPIVIDGTLATSDGSTMAVLPTTYLPLGGQM